MRYRNFLLVVATALTVASPIAAVEQAPPIVPAVEVTAAIPNAAVTSAFLNFDGWTGGDAAYSVPVTKSRSLWLFGDTFIGKIQNGVRMKATMVHNTAAWLDRRSNGSYKTRYFWRTDSGRPAALVQPEGPTKAYYWPSGMALVGNKLALFCKLVVDKPGDDSGFGFDWVAQELVLVDNPAPTEPCNWTYKPFKLPGGEAAIMPGSACLAVDEYTYVFSTIEEKSNRPCVLMRIPSSDLAKADVSKFQYWVDKGEWTNYPSAPPVRLFEHAAPEMSVSKVAGLPGYWAVYSEDGLSPNILLRHAPKPEGPWSDPLLLYRAPEALRDPKLLCYGAKHHPELSSVDRTLLITYCLNPGPLSAHRTQPLAYFPKAITVTLKPTN